MRIVFTYFFMLLFIINTNGKNPNGLKVAVVFKYGKTELSNKNEMQSISDTDTMKFETVKMYLSNFVLFKGNEKIYSEKNSYHLFDVSDSSTMSFRLPVIQDLNFDYILFDLGIDSTTNSGGARGGDLDPTKGMYWTWQSGYINFKIDATNSDPNSKFKDFSLHIGGYSFPENSLQHISLGVKDKSQIQIVVDLEKFIRIAEGKNITHVMSPGKKAVDLSVDLASCISTK